MNFGAQIGCLCPRWASASNEANGEPKKLAGHKLERMAGLMIPILLTEAKPKFLLSCKVIAGICQNDGFCLDEMSIRFPDCYLEGQIDSFQPKIGRPALVEEANASQRFLKRAPAMKLMKVLMMKDRIPVGRR
uniref:Uncharacterized protein n=1 Tax=Globodera rostochiensis TaxID=31243 RepID=A0A914HIR2_GLORO